MTTSSIVLIVAVVIAAILCIGAIAWVARKKRNQHLHVEAGKIREAAANEETRQVKQREALAEETAAKARAAQAEADIKAAQASGLEQRAAGHRSEAATARDELNQEFERADKMDPATQTPKKSRTADRKEPQHH